MRRFLSTAALLLALPILPAWSQDDESDELRREVRELREHVEAQDRRIEELSQTSKGLDQSIENYLYATDRPDGAARKPRSGYDGWFFIQSANGKFRLNIGGYAQARYDWNHRESAPAGESRDTRGFSLHRLRLYFQGKFTEKFNYHVRLNVNSSGEVSLINAWGQFNLPDGWNVRAGMIFVALSREDWMFADDTLSSDYSANDDTFGIDTSIGLQLNRQWERQQFWVAFSNGRNGGDTSFTSDETADWAFSGRFERQIVGTDWSVWNDLAGRRGRARGILWGIAALVQGKVAPYSADSPKRLAVVTSDLSFAGDGYQALISATWQQVQVGDGTPTFYNWGVMAQSGYFFTRTWEAFGRWDFVSPGDQPGSLDDYNALTAGANWFPFEDSNRFKLTIELAYLFSALSNTIVSPGEGIGFLSSDSADQFYFRVQFQFGF
jgi:hypothetical protein